MPKKILIVDDEPNIIISLEYIMRKSGFDVVSASDGERAIEILLAEGPDLLILDVMIPQKNGYEVCAEVRADQRFQKLPILMLSAKGRENEVKKGMSIGADAYISKPFSTYDLVDKVKELMRLND